MAMRRVRKTLVLDSWESTEKTGSLSTNKDLMPVPLDSPERTWTWPSTSVSKGLNPGLAILAVFIGWRSI
ncbi:hypothetical protein LTR56_003053 [Elasticomyces elasticus]|nr:hypothetical protein LTR56_003053 [Elasticomyces elasticus]KAK3662115.1 hypothetical protein LTR22_007088 [Elasticomyces elasticus]KAK4927522.1 hypothetical protein LTR49_005662 [Elasticomyces elasticus]KAK5743704.1 hypothetical protein LTS12_023785 [Elasticomyces elasticus]